MGNLGTSCCRMWTSWNWPQTWCSSGSTNMPMLWHLTSILAHTYGTLLQSLHTRMVRLQLSEMAAGFHVWLWKNLCTNRNSIRVWGAGRCIRITNLLAMGWHPTNALDWHTKCQPCLYWYWLLSGHFAPFLSWHHSRAHHFYFSLLGIKSYVYLHLYRRRYSFFWGWGGGGGGGYLMPPLYLTQTTQLNYALQWQY